MRGKRKLLLLLSSHNSHITLTAKTLKKDTQIHILSQKPLLGRVHTYTTHKGEKKQDKEATLVLFLVAMIKHLAEQHKEGKVSLGF